MHQTIYKSTPVDPYSNRGLVSRRNMQDTGCIFWFFKLIHETKVVQRISVYKTNWFTRPMVHPVSPEAMETTVRDVNVLLSFSAAFSFFSFCGVWHNGVKSIMRNQFMRNQFMINQLWNRISIFPPARFHEILIWKAENLLLRNSNLSWKDGIFYKMSRNI